MTDKELIDLIKENPSRGFEKLIDLYSGLVFSVVSATLVPVGTKEDAQECASDVFVFFYRNLENIDLKKGTVKGYLAVCAKHTAISALRKLKSRGGGNVISLDENENLFSQSEDIEKNERSRLVRQAVEALGEPDSTIIIRRYFFGETAKEIAKDLKMTHEAVMKRASRARKKLKETLGGVLCG
ncbi:MAG: RNA polymerase sigma factor [Acutalibacteraceae bacterium]